MADIEIEDITPSALDSTDRAMVRRGAGPLDHTIELVDLGAELNLRAPLASPTFTGTVTLPAGQVVNGVTLATGGPATEYLDGTGGYSTPAGGGSSAYDFGKLLAASNRMFFN